ncbi:Acetylcholinesterase [Strongyloides ratti]|uniref:Carboxylic ester hydrolase n=1 Tax=Strongyloides ratti TaxID=34506 RepID=A0A090L0T3_STRRB|nr:Acetylcholinesterase [Strongyloides ratti]CEF63281.1 Acetylcholinesterase [Strongyloides ratti]
MIIRKFYCFGNLYLIFLVILIWIKNSKSHFTSTQPLIYLSDGSPILGQTLLAPNGKIVTQFLGVPFAEPPIGNLRFRKPLPKKPWRHVLNATTPPNACVQSLDTYFGDFFGADSWNCHGPLSEDCLYLNIYIPNEIDSTKKLAVLIWIYGGGFWSGCSSLDVYDGKIFATEENVIIVTLNYRVTVFGFLYMGREEAPGNMGLWDQLMAMKWVHKHIEVFGGDPETVTIFGESAGAASVSMHMLSEKSTPYFKRAILQSGSATAPWALENRKVALHRVLVVYEHMKCGNISRNLDEVNMDKVLDCFMKASAKKILDSEWSPVMEFADFPWVPVIDGDFLVEQASTSLKEGRFKKTDLLVGSNQDEAIYFIVYQLGDIFPPEEFFVKKEFIKNRENWIRSIHNLLPRQFLKNSLAMSAIIHEYEPNSLPVKPQSWVDSLDKMLGDFQFTCNVNEFALAHAIHGGQTYYYMFSHRASEQTWPEWMGVLHGYEINFIFGEPYNTDKYSYTKEEQELASRFMRYWANFARTGNPNKNPDGTFTADNWPKYTQHTMEYMNLTIESAYANGAKLIGTGPRRKECSFWKAVLPNLITATNDVGESVIHWRNLMSKWENEYIVDWQFHFEQYKKYQSYRHSDANGYCDL